MMKKSVAIVLALVLAFAFSAVAFAQATAPKTTAEPQKPTETPKKEVHKTFHGTVVSVDAIANMIVVKGKKAEETFSVEPAAKIVINKKAVKLADIKKGNKVTVKYKVEDGKKVAVGIK
jgi:hypothetical protein